MVENQSGGRHRHGGGGGKSISFQLVGKDSGVLAELAEEACFRLQEIPGLVDPWASSQSGGLELFVDIDRELASLAGFRFAPGPERIQRDNRITRVWGGARYEEGTIDDYLPRVNAALESMEFPFGYSYTFRDFDERRKEKTEEFLVALPFAAAGASGPSISPVWISTSRRPERPDGCSDGGVHRPAAVRSPCPSAVVLQFSAPGRSLSSDRCVRDLW